MSDPATAPRNRLAGETSPYLRQHAANPVDWFPWGEEAFARARSEDKPVFLSIGYSTCHWCHVMAHESFEDRAVAALLNEHFISVKVDREERPDVDRVYMTYVQATTGSGGWPMSVWLTPERLPFYGGTYFPPDDRMGRPGFASVLQALARIWREDRGRILQQGAHAADVLRSLAARAGAGDAELAPESLTRALGELRENFDAEWGGFGGAPKFPRPAVLQFLWRMHAAERKRSAGAAANDARQMAEVTLRRMCAGGLHDHIGGGFHRYSVDAFWHVPHFEKMLYDQAQLVMVLLEGWQATGEKIFADAARDTLTYVQRDLMAADGGFFAAEDADSLRRAGSDERAEGAFYVWTADEVRAVLGGERARIFCGHYGVEEGGNAAESDPHGELTGQNVLIERRTLAETAAVHGRAPEATIALLAECRAQLFAAREKRPRPHRDEKIVAAWNGLMISAFARAAQAFDDLGLIAAALRAAGFVRRELWDRASGVLRRSFCAGRVGGEGFAEDYACVVQAALDLYAATYDVQWLEWATELQAAQDRLFGDEAAGGYFSSSGRDASVLVRLKEDHDGAEPAPSSVAAFNLLRLGRMTGDAAWLERARRTLLAFGDTWSRAPQALPLMLAAVADWLQPPRQIVLAGKPGAEDFAALAREVRRRFLPGTVVLAADGGASQQWLGERVPYLRDIQPVGGRAAAYVCENFACQFPVTEPARLAQLLERGTRA